MTPRRLAPILVLLLSIAGCTSPSPSARSDVEDTADAIAAAAAASFTMDGMGCRELLMQVSVPAESARAFVPSGYSIRTEPGGQAFAFAGLKVCEDLVLEGVSTGAGSTSDVGVLIESPDGTDGIHYYQTWWHTDHLPLWTRLGAQGWLAGYVPDDELMSDFGAMPAGASFDVPWRDGAYAAEARLLSGAVPTETPATGWHDGRYGTVRVVKTLAGTQTGAGTGTLTAQAGSPLATLMGATSEPAAALWSVYDMTGRVAGPG